MRRDRCGECGKRSWIWARGRCESCYRRALRAEAIARDPEAVRKRERERMRALRARWKASKENP
jgi:hypothetical protein